MRTEVWYLTPDGWIRGTTVDDLVETEVPPPSQHAAILNITRASAESWVGARYRLLPQDEARVQPLAQQFGELPPPLAEERKRVSETLQREASQAPRSPLPTADKLAIASLVACAAQAAALFAFLGDLGVRSGHESEDSTLHFLRLVTAFFALAAQIVLTIAAYSAQRRGARSRGALAIAGPAALLAAIISGFLIVVGFIAVSAVHM